VLRAQLKNGLAEVSPENLVIAYEPVWAIGTGKTATTQQAEEAHRFIKDWLLSKYGKEEEKIRIIYGGSVTPENIDSLMACESIEGVLVGGASLNVDSFSRIVKFKRRIP
ncbi:MAG: triose-phosphate isomerase, partial [Thermodesulfovibrionales bacterium]|nr:triose-phosphate isomerase [Thermodesulfovibrionales bacterium]